MQIINVPGIGPVQFPDDMTDDQIVQAIERDILPQESARAQQQPQQTAVPRQQEPTAEQLGRGFFERNIIDPGRRGFQNLMIGTAATRALYPDSFFGLSAEEAAQAIGERQRTLEQIPRTEASQRAFREAAETQSVPGAVGRIASSSSALGDIALESLGTNPVAAPVGMLANVTPVPVVRQVIGAIAGALGFPTEYLTSVGGGVLEAAQRRGIDVRDTNQVAALIREINANPEMRESIRSDALTRAGIITAADVAAGYGAGRLVSRGPIGRIGGAAAIEGVGGGAGEAAAQLATTGVIEPVEVAAEIIGGAGMGALGNIRRSPEQETGPRGDNLPPDLREAIDQYVANRDLTPQGPLLLPREARDIETPVGSLSRSQLERYMERSLPSMIEAEPAIASRMEAAGSDNERLSVFRDILAEREQARLQKASLAQNMMATRDEARRAFEDVEVQRRTGRRPPPSPAILQRDLEEADRQIGALVSARDSAIQRLARIEGAPTLDINARDAARAEIAQLDQVISGRQQVRDSIASSIPETERDIVARQNLRQQAGEAFDIAEARRGRFEQQVAADEVPIELESGIAEIIPQQVDDTRSGAAMITDQRYIINPEYKGGRIVGGENVVDIVPTDGDGNIIAVVRRNVGGNIYDVPIETNMRDLVRVPIRESARQTQEARAASFIPPRGVGLELDPRIAVDRQGPQASARATRAAEDEQQAEREPTEAEARTSRRVEAQDRINALYLNKLLGMGAQGRLLRNGLVKALKDRDLSADQVYAAFVAADVMAQVLPKGANHRIEFVKSLLAPSSSTVSRSGGKEGEQIQGLRWAPNQDGLEGLIKISLAPEQLDILGETAAHEAFHILQDYFGRYDPKFADLMSRGFRDNMMITDVDPTIRRKLEQVKVPGSDQSYWQRLTATLPNVIEDAKEAQAYVFGSLFDASRRGVPMSGLKPAFARFVNMVKNFFSKMGSALRGDGFQTVEQVLGRVVREGGRRFDQDVVPGVRGPGAQASARAAPPFIRSVRQLLEDAKTASSWRDWYQRYEQQLEDLFGADAALFRQLLSATSQASGVAPNVTLALKAYEQLLTNKPFVGYLPAVIKNLERIKAEQSLSGQKISQYGKANETSKDAGEGVAIDRHVARLMFGVDRPSKAMVQKATRTIQGIARILGWQPREVQAALWAFNQIKEGVDPTNVKSYDFYLAKKQDDIRALRASISRGEGRSVLSGEAASRGVGEARTEGEQVEGGLTEPQAQASARATNTTVPEFRNWWNGGWRGAGGQRGPSAASNPDGSPMTMYHGTPRSFERFSKARSGAAKGMEGPFFFSPDPGFASDYAESDLSAGGRGMPVRQGAKIYPVYISVQNPFDYENSEHVQSVLDAVKMPPGRGMDAARVLRDSVRLGMWRTLEQPYVQRAIRDLGFDGFYLKEGGVKNLAVYDPRQVKSIFNQFQEGAATQPQFSARQVNTPEFQRWFGDSKVVDADGNPLVVYHGTSKDKDFDKFKVGPRGAWFTTNPSEASAYAEENDSGYKIVDYDPKTGYVRKDISARVIPTYLSIKNPARLSQPQKEKLQYATNYAKAQKEVFEELRSSGYDGVDMGGGIWVVLNSPSQIKSAIGNRGTFDPNDPRIQASARTPLARDPSYSAVVDKITGKQYDKPNPFSAALRAFTGALPGESNSSALLRTTVNRAAPGWMLDRLAKEKGLSVRSVGRALEVALNNSGRVQMYLDHGPLSYDPKTGDVKVRGDVPGLMAAIKGRLNPKDKREAQAYLVALRERDLRKTGKQGFFNLTDTEISQIISKAERNHPDWKQMAADLQKINKALLEFAVNTGTLDQSKANQLANIFYTPFYRQAEEDGKSNADSVIGPRLSDSLTKVKTAFDVKMEGGESPLGDLFQNLIRNADVIMKAGMKNVAMRQAADVMEAVGLGRKLKTRVAGKTMTYRVDGKDQHFEVDDPVLYMTLAGAPREFTNGLYKAMATFAGFLREAITLAPSFMLGNLWRGKFMAYVQEGVPLYANTFGGLKQALQASASYKAIAAQTGFGGYTYGMGERDAAKAFEKEIENLGYTSPRGLMRKAIKGLRDFSEATEMAERIKLYERAKAAGMSDKEAAFQAYLLAPFSRRGMGGGLAGDFVSFLVPLVPFLNARIQGLYRLIENEKGDTQKIWTLGLPKQLLLRGLIVTGLSVALAAMNMDFEPDRWNNENPDLKFRYDIVYLPGGNRLLLPRAFEVGSVFGAIPVFLLDAYRRQDGSDLAKALGDLGKSTFFFNPIPAAVVPLIGAFTNYDFFRARPLENAGDMRKLTEERINRNTTTAARLVGAAMGISPIRAQYLLEGYSGTIGTMIFAGLDNIFASLGMIPGKPAGAFGDPMSMPAIIAGLTGASRFYRSDDQSATRFIGDFYRIKEMTDQIVRSQNMAVESRDLDRLAELRGAEGLPLRIRPMVNSASTRISEISARMARIERSDMDATSKAEALRSLRQQRDMIARNVVEAARRIGAY